ncbi:hypothetical protein DFQ27_002518, partial [Actinomortierella ambigua]
MRRVILRDHAEGIGDWISTWSSLNKHTKVLCLDEATAAIDIKTNNAIQKALRRSLQGCTVLTIAHRINTILDSDRILVLDHGRVA